MTTWQPVGLDRLLGWAIIAGEFKYLSFQQSIQGDDWSLSFPPYSFAVLALHRMCLQTNVYANSFAAMVLFVFTSLC